MTIDELLTEARRYTKLALSNTTGDRATLAQIAQACAQTAQAMIAANMDRRDAERHAEWLEDVFGEKHDDLLED